MKIKKFFSNNKLLIIILSAIILVSIIGLNLQSVLFPDSTGYIIDSFEDGKITYTSVITQTQGGGFLMTNNVWTQWAGGTGANWIFYNHLDWLKYYVDNGLKINSNEFNILAGDGNQVSYGCHLRPNYCKDPYGDYEFIGIDSDGCPRYNIYTVSQRCWCCPGWKECDTNPCAGAAQCGCTPCNERTLSQSNYGGSISGTKNYKSILETDGWSYDWQENCWMKGEANKNTAEKITEDKFCRVYGTFEDEIAYSYYGKMEWVGKDDGYNCRITDTFESKKISNGQVEFSQTVSLNFYRFENNSCNSISLVPSKKTSNDYSTFEECNSNIVTEQTLENKTQETNDSENSSNNESNILLTFFTILIIIAFAVGLTILFIKIRNK
jgi:hypothetical protein